MRIRLRRVGRKKQPYFRVVVADGDAPRDGAYVEEVGFYNPRTRPAVLRLDLERVDEWLARGAVLTGSAASLVKKARKGGDADVALVQPGAEAPSLKTARRPERRPAASPAVTPEAEAEAPTEAPESVAPEAEKEEPAEAATGGETAEAVAAEEPKESAAPAEAEAEAEAAAEAPAEPEAEPETEAESETEEEKPEA